MNPIIAEPANLEFFSMGKCGPNKHEHVFIYRRKVIYIWSTSQASNQRSQGNTIN